MVGRAIFLAVSLLAAGAWTGAHDVRADRPATALPDPQAGRELAASLGCGGCHVALPGAGILEVAPAFGLDDEPVSAEFVFTYLENPVSRRPEIAPARMPDFDLGESERLSLALFLGAPGTAGPDVEGAGARLPAATADRGRELFAGLRCGACHAGPGADPVPLAPDLSRAGDRLQSDWIRQWLANPVPVRPLGHGAGASGGMPDFRLSAEEVTDLADYLATLGGGGGDWVPQELSAARTERAARLLDTRFACAGCHRIGGTGGALGPSLEGIGERLSPDAVRAMIADPRSALPGTTMPSQGLRTEDAELLATYLLARPEPWVPASGAPDLGGDPWGPDDEGARLYGEHCASCHGTEGRGDGWNATNLPVTPTVHADSLAMSNRADDTLFDGIYGGGWVLEKSSRMPAFGDILSPTEIRALVRHIRELCGCEGPSWSRPGSADR